MTREQANLLLKKKPHALDDTELYELVPVLKCEVDHRHRECSKFLGTPCQEGKRKFDAYRWAKTRLSMLKRECSRRGIHPLTDPGFAARFDVQRG